MKYKKYIIGTVIGGLLGFAYYIFIGCNGGACPITSNPLHATIYGGIMGFLVSNLR